MTDDDTYYAIDILVDDGMGDRIDDARTVDAANTTT
jgi:hypothetical protein